MKKPNFFIVGAAKSGTTSLYNYLDQHPDVYMSPIKEPHYFSKDIKMSDFNEEYKKRVEFDISSYLSKDKLEKKHILHIENLDDYLQLFRENNNEKCLGEVSNGYLFSKVAAQEIYDFNPNAKIIIILRNPIERAFSHWIMGIQLGIVKNKSFFEQTKNDYSHSKKGWGQSHLFIELGLYYEQIKRYFDVFPSENIKVFIFDDLKNNSKNVKNELFDFLNIGKLESIDFTKKYNVTRLPKNKLISMITNNRFIKNSLRGILTENRKIFLKNMLYSKDSIPILTNNDRHKLLPYFINDIKKLEKLLERKLDSWYE